MDTTVVFSRRKLFLTSGVGALSAVLAACSSQDDGPAQDLANQLADALSKKDISGLSFVDDSGESTPNERLDFATAYMGSSTPTVTVSGLENSQSGKSANLHWSWAIPGSTQPFEYDSTAYLAKTDDTWKVQWQASIVHPQLKDSQSLRAQVDAASRGSILGANNAEIVTLRPVVQVGLDKSKLTDESAQESSAKSLASLVDIDSDTYVSAVKNGGDQQFVLAITLRQEAFEALDQTKLNAITGIYTVDDKMQLAPTADFAPDILGSVGEASADDIANSNGTLASGDQIGQGGLQAKFNDILAGTSGYSVDIVNLDSTGTAQEDGAQSLATVEKKDGQSLTTTLNVDLQTKAIDLLKDFESPSALVALRVSTGELVVSANGSASDGYSTALLAQYAPGSTFKIASSLALVRKGFTADSTVNCSETATVGGRTFSNATGYATSALGEQPLTVAMAHSCNTAFINEHDTVSQADLQDAARGLGLEMELDLGVGTFMGSIPDTSDEVTHASDLIGQGDILTSPLAMAVLTASAAKGEIVKPYLVKDQGLADAKPAGGTAVTTDESTQLKTLMRAVVTEGYLTDLQSLNPNDAMGKTGTAEYGSDNPPKTHSWVVAVHNDLAVALVVEDGDLGSITGQPVVLSFLEAAQG